MNNKQQAQEVVDSSSSAITINNKVFNPLQHRTQGGARQLSIRDKIRYVKNEMSTNALCPSCRIPNKVSTISIMQNVLAEDLLIRDLINKSKSSAADVVVKDEITELPLEYYELIKNYIMEYNQLDNEIMWIKFGQWLGLKDQINRRDVVNYLRLKWKKNQNAAERRNSKIPEIFQEILEIEERTDTKKKNLIMLAQNYKNFRYVTYPECIVDNYNKTLVHFGELDDYEAVNKATEAVKGYYFHMLENDTHRSDSFWKDLTEHFGAFISYSDLPYTTSNTASSHNITHAECVNNLLYALQPISNSINRFAYNYHTHYYTKLSNLSLGPFVPRPFGIFPTIAINFNVISNYHWDIHDDPNGLCFLIALGDFEGGELCFPQLQIVVKLKPGQVVVFPSGLLLHGNLPILKGIRFSIVYFVHSLFLSKDYNKLYTKKTTSNIIIVDRQDLYVAKGNPDRPFLTQATKEQTKVKSVENSETDQRRYKDGLERARRGLKAEDPLS